MIKKCKFTPEFIDNLEIPKSGERWVSDTDTLGLVVRLASYGNGSKTFYIRRSINGASIRRALCPATGDQLDRARNWAKYLVGDLLDPPGKRKYYSGWQRKTYETWKCRIKNLSLNDWVQICLEFKKRSGQKINKIERDEERYHQYIEPELGEWQLLKITAEDIIQCLKNIELKAGQAENLYYFMKFVFEFAGDFNLEIRNVAFDLSNNYSSPYDRYSIYDYPIFRKDYDRLFKFLENQKKYFQKAMLIRICFALRLKPKNAVSRVWADSEKMRARENYFSKRKEDILLKRIHDFNEANFPHSPFLFPSNKAYKTGHISFEPEYWKDVCDECKLPAVPLHKILKHYNFSGMARVHLIEDSEQYNSLSIYLNENLFSSNS